MAFTQRVTYAISVFALVAGLGAALYASTKEVCHSNFTRSSSPTHTTRVSGWARSSCRCPSRTPTKITSNWRMS